MYTSIVLICPNCRAEYREGFTSCSDCHVLLVRKLPVEPEIVPEPGDPSGDPFCSFWKGDDQRLHAELCYVLNEAKIPHRTVRRQDHLFNLSNYPAFQIGVPFSLYEAAENAVRDAFALDPADPEAVQNLVAPPLITERVENIRKLPESLSPPLEEDLPGPPAATEDDDSLLDEETLEIWSGDDPSSREMFVAALNENDIPSRWEGRNHRYALLVAPANELRAREIIREIVECSPPTE